MRSDDERRWKTESAVPCRSSLFIAFAASSLLLCSAVAAEGALGCFGDCDGNGAVTLAELRLAVEIALVGVSADECAAVVAGESGAVAVDDLIRAVSSRRSGCPGVTPTPTATATPTASPAPEQLPPTSAAALVAWLQEGRYHGWRAESGIHASVGPHFGRVRTFLNEAVFDSLAAGDAQHPQGSALVKELYGNDGEAVRGWSVMVKTAGTSDAGVGWYWYERFGSSTFASSNGNPLCTGCHGSDYRGLESRDYVLTPFPLQ